MNKIAFASAALLAATPLAWNVQAQSHGTDHGSHAPAAGAATAATAADAVRGEVRRVDREARKLTLRHGPIPNLEMAAMTMVFQVRDARLLDGLAPGDVVRFRADRVDGVYLVTDIERAP